MSLVDSINSYLTNEVITRLAATLGESAGSTQRGLSTAAVPAILQGIAQHSATQPGLRRIMDLLPEQAHDNGLLTNLAAAFGGGAQTDALLGEGKTLLANLLGDRADAVAELIASSCYLRRSSATALLSLAGPVALSALAKPSVSKASVASALSDLPKTLSRLPVSLPGLAAALGIAKLGDVPPSTGAASGGFRASWIIAPAALALLGYSLNSCQPQRTQPDPAVTVSAPDIAAPTAPAKPSASAVVDEPPATPVAAPTPAPLAPTPLEELTRKIAKGSTAYELAQFLADPESAAPHSFVLRNMHFASGTADITAESRPTLVDVSRVLNVFANARVMLQGHTDNVGAADDNYALSQSRANAAQDILIKLGIAPARLTTAGFGANRPIANNDTPAGRRANRRTELLVTVK